MELDEQAYESMNRYLLGEMDDAAMTEFQERLKDPEFASEFELQQQVFAASRQLGRDQFRAELKAIEEKVLASSESSEAPEEDSSTADNNPFVKQSWFRMAAVLLIFVVVGLSLWLLDPFGMRGFDPVRTGQQNSTFYALNLTERCCESNKAIDTYNAQDYPKAITQLSAIPKQDTLYLEVQFCLGVAYLLTEPAQAEAAVAPLLTVADEPGFFLAPQANWYAALAYLQSGDLPAAKARLTTLTCTDCFHAEEAATILEKMEKAGY